MIFGDSENISQFKSQKSGYEEHKINPHSSWQCILIYIILKWNELYKTVHFQAYNYSFKGCLLFIDTKYSLYSFPMYKFYI